jgi:hypothetical protein
MPEIRGDGVVDARHTGQGAGVGCTADPLDKGGGGKLGAGIQSPFEWCSRVEGLADHQDGRLDIVPVDRDRCLWLERPE